MIEIFATERLKAVLPKIDSFIREEVIPAEHEMLNTPFFELEKGILNELRKKVKSEGLWAPHLHEEEGGLNLNFMEFAQVSEIMSLTPYGHFLFNCHAPDIGNMELMGKYASENLKDKFLKPIQEGEIRSCFSGIKPCFNGNYSCERGLGICNQRS